MSTSSDHVATAPRTRHELNGFAAGDVAAYLEGRLLGAASSFRASHNHPGDLAPAGTRCSSCRWFEVKIFRTSDDPVEYTVYTAGFSNHPGEVTLPKLQRTASAFDVVELLTVRNSEKGTFLPKPNARALAQAAGFDAHVQDAYLNRATV